MADRADKPQLIVDGKRLDGRKAEELRPIRIEASVLKNADGSAYLEWGKNKILAAVMGPKPVAIKRAADPNKAIIKCRYAMAPFASKGEHKRAGINRRAQEISKVTKEAFEEVVLTRSFPNSEIDIYVEVLQGDGGTRAAGITAASVALASAGIPMKDLIYAVSVGKAEGKLILDLDKIEDNYSDCDMPMAVSPRNNDIVLLQMDGDLDRAELRQAMEMAVGAGKAITRAQREALERVYAERKVEE